MQNSSNEYREQDFCTAEQGLDYSFAKMGAIYGATFLRNWQGVDPNLVHQVWLQECGRMLTYRPKIDHALRFMHPERPPSALSFKNLLVAGPVIPDKPNFHVEKQKTREELEAQKRRGEEAREQLRQLTKKLGTKNASSQSR